MRLAELQTRLVADITAGGDSLAAHLTTRDVGARIGAYRANVADALFEALDNAYPVTREVLGPRYWRTLLAREIALSSSHSPDLDAYGDFVPGLLAGLQRARAELADFDYLADLARLEWRVHRLRFAARDATFPWREFAALSPSEQDACALSPANSLAVLASPYPVDALWRLHRAPGAETTTGAPPYVFCLHRATDFGITVTRLDRASAALMDGVLRGDRLDTLARLAPTDGRDELVRRLFAWIGAGWIAGFEAPSCSTSKR